MITNHLDPKFVAIDTKELDDFLTHVEAELAPGKERRHQVLDDLLKLSGNRSGLIRAVMKTNRDGSEGPTCVLEIKPTREFIENVDREVARRRKARQEAER